jgi:hypothetical protein
MGTLRQAYGATRRRDCDEGSLPSVYAARHLVNGKPGALLEVVATTAGRSVLSGLGLYAVGLRGKPLLQGAVASAAAIECFVLAWVWREEHQRGRAWAEDYP